jgi:ketosteroid isomerase-like protein
MKRFILITYLLPLLFNSCIPDEKNGSINEWKQEIVNTELEFAEMAKNEGISKAFLTFAADNAVLMRNNKLIIGKEALKRNFDSRKSDSGKVSLSWEPDFVDVSASGDLGYTYGKYLYTFIDSVGNIKQDSGIFHTVWKRQPSGEWRFVWD